MFASRIEGAAARAGITVKVMDTLEKFIEEAKQNSPQVALVNLDAAEGKLSTLEDLAKGSSCKVVGYYSHVNSNLAVEAQRIGIRVALSRGAFVNQLGGILRELSSD